MRGKEGEGQVNQAAVDRQLVAAVSFLRDEEDNFQNGELHLQIVPVQVAQEDVQVYAAACGGARQAGQRSAFGAAAAAAEEESEEAAEEAEEEESEEEDAQRIQRGAATKGEMG